VKWVCVGVGVGVRVSEEKGQKYAIERIKKRALCGLFFWIDLGIMAYLIMSLVT